MGMKDKMGLFAMAAMLSATAEHNPMFDPIKPTIHIPKEPPVPKGAKTYWFDEQGNFSFEQMRKDEVVFKCVAINDKNAIKKYEKYCKILKCSEEKSGSLT